MKQVVGLLWGVTLAAFGCSSNQKCTPGEQTSCACPGGSQGAQVCMDDGSGYNDCFGCTELNDMVPSQSTDDHTPPPDLMMSPDLKSLGDMAKILDLMPAPVCGNDVVETGEQCDNGSNAKCSGCEACQKRNWLNVPPAASATAAGAANLLPVGDATYEAWVETDGVNTDAVYFSSYTANNNGSFMVHCSAGMTLMYGSNSPNGGAALVKATLHCGDKAWHHVAACRSLSNGSVTMTLYWDGMQVAQGLASAAMIGAPAALVIGGTSYLQQGLFGSIDEVHISNVVRYKANFVPVRRITADANTVALYHFDEGAGNTAADASGNAMLTAALKNTTWSPDTGYLMSFCQ